MRAAGGRRSRSESRRRRSEGSIDALPSGALRVRVFAGRDRLTGKRLELTETIPAGTPDQQAVAERKREEILQQIADNQHPRTNVTVRELVDRYLDEWQRADKTLMTYRGYVRNHIGPLIGQEKACRVDDDLLESMYRELQRCRRHCTGGPLIDHRTTVPHLCDARCRPHTCTPLGTSAIRHIHFLLSGAYTKAIKKWKWLTANPCHHADPPASNAPDPKPPTPTQATTILHAAWQRDEDWGTLLWLKVTTGARRGELCALRWSDLDLDAPGQEVMSIKRGVARAATRNDKRSASAPGARAPRWREGPTKTHQHRRIALDPKTVQILRDYRERSREHAAAAGVTIAADAFLFSVAADHSTFRTPDSLTTRYKRLVDTLGITTTLHQLRHYSVTDLIQAGVDIRTVAGRVGHGGGGTTTLKVYAAFISEADQRAAGILGDRMPDRPVRQTPAERAMTAPQNPYEKIASAYRQQILSGAVSDGDHVPTVKAIAAAYDVAVGTAHRAIDLLRTWGLATGGGRGRPNLFVVPPALDVSVPTTTEPSNDAHAELESDRSAETHETKPAEELDLEIIHLGMSVRTVRTIADPTNTQEMLQLLTDTVRRAGGDLAALGDYEMVVRYAGERGSVTTFVAPPAAGDGNAHATGQLAAVS